DLGVACVAAVFVPGTVPVTQTLPASGGTVVTVDPGLETIDVPFPVGTGQETGYAVNPTSLLSFNQFVLQNAQDSTGLGTVFIDRSFAPQVLSDGYTV